MPCQCLNRIEENAVRRPREQQMALRPKVGLADERKCIALQRKLNDIFVARRDGGKDAHQIYAQLQIVERRLNQFYVVW